MDKNPDTSLDAPEICAAAVEASPAAAETWPSDNSSPVSVRVAPDPAEPPVPTVDLSALRSPADELSLTLQPPEEVSVSSCENEKALATAVEKLFRPQRFASESDRKTIDALFDKIADDVCPRDVIEQVWCEQFSMLVVDASRLRSPYAQLTAEVDELAPQLGNLHVLAKRLPQLCQLNQLLANNEARQFALLREIERHRATLAQRLRSAVEQVEDAEFQELDH